MYLYMVYILYMVYSVGNLDTYLFIDLKKIGVGIDLVASFVVCTQEMLLL